MGASTTAGIMTPISVFSIWRECAYTLASKPAASTDTLGGAATEFLKMAMHIASRTDVACAAALRNGALPRSYMWRTSSRERRLLSSAWSGEPSAILSRRLSLHSARNTTSASRSHGPTNVAPPTPFAASASSSRAARDAASNAQRCMTAPSICCSVAVPVVWMLMSSDTSTML